MQPRVNILTEQAVRSDMARLDEAWGEAASLVILPDRVAGDTSWIDRSLAALPDFLRSGHFLMLTSGSTGEPKIVVGSKARAEQLARVLHVVQDNASVRQAILSLPISYSYSFVNQWLWSRVHRVPLTVTGGLAAPGDFIRAIRAAKSGMLCLVGVQVPMLMSYIGAERFSGITRINFAGGRFPQERLEELGRAFPEAVVLNNFGCAEAMPRLTVRTASESDDASNIGKPIPGVALSQDSDGALLFRSDYGAVAIVDGPSSVRQVGDEEWLSTGDQADQCPNGSWRLLGRRGEVFKRYGEKVSIPALLHVVLRGWSGQAAFYRERDSRGEEGHVLVLSPTTHRDTARQIAMLIAEAFPRAAWPIRIECVESMPLLSNEKIDAAALSARQGKDVLWAQRI